MQVSGNGEMEATNVSGAGGEAEEPHAPNGSSPHVDLSPGNVEREKGGADHVEGTVVESVNLEGDCLVSKVVGPEVVMGFKGGSGQKCKRIKRRGNLGSKFAKAQPQSKGNKDKSPDDTRPKKRSRNCENEDEPGFGFIGFTSRLPSQLDLNSRAHSTETLAADSLSQGNHQLETLLRKHGGVSDEELAATVDIGAQVGVEFGSSSLNAIKDQGISGGLDKQRWVKNLKGKHGISFIALQESKKSSVKEADIMGFWGNKRFGFDSVDSVGLSGGLVCIWDPSVFRLSSSVKNRNYLLIRGTLKGCGSALNFINVYAPQSVVAKKMVWDEIYQLISDSDGFWVITGDFNAVRSREEKKNCGFKSLCASNFNSFIFDAGLLEYNMTGRKFTYSSPDGRKQSKLDRFLVNSDFFAKWPDASVVVVPTVLSDHSPIILKTVLCNFGPKPFRIFDSWFDKPGFHNTVVSALGKDFGDLGSPDVNLMKKLSVLRADLKVWRDEMLKKSSEEVMLAQSELESIQAASEVRELSEDEEWILLESKKIIKEDEERKTSDFRQRSRIKWSKEGDENSSFFHSMVNCRKASNSMHGLEVDGNWVSKPSLVKKEVFKFFRAKFVEECEVRPRLQCAGINKLSDAEASNLESRFSKEEIKAAVFECGDDRAPGPDGVNFRFVKRFWDVLEVDFVKILDDFYCNGVINTGCGSSFIAMIPKASDPIGLNDFRPISLVGVINKVISKVLACRLKKVMDKIISPTQSAFIGGRYILDGPLILNEILRWSKKVKNKIFVFKIDFEKAYDNVHWNFVLEVLNQMGFSARWCSWIKGILSSARASVLVNGSPTFEFKCHKGMRQGDPISPFLFVIVMEALSRMLVKACNLEIVKGIGLPNGGPEISHLLYADDAVIIGDWSSANIQNVVRILRCFHLCSGLKINLSKSKLFGVGVQPREVEEMGEMIGCGVDSFPCKFLGLNVGANMNRYANWRPVFEVFEKRLSLWKASLLSIGGRVTLIRSVLESLPNYYMSLYRAPVKVLQDLESLIRKFLWGGTPEVKKVHWVAWDRVASPVKMGGLGLQNLRDINIALLSKWGWRYKNEQDGLWVKVVDAFHSGGSDWGFLPVKKALGGVWTNIVSTINRPLFDDVSIRNLFKGEVNTGDKILFWLDPWLFDVPLKERYPALFKLEVVKSCRVRDRLEGNGLWLWRHDPSSAEELAEWLSLESAITSVNLSSGTDKWTWQGSGSNGFSVAAVKRHIGSLRDFSNRYVMDWCSWVPKKCNIFAWRAELDRIATVEALQTRGITVIDDVCNFCNEGLDSVMHIFSACPFALGVWEKISFWCRIPRFSIFSFRDLLEVHKVGNKRQSERDAIHGIVITASWVLWKARNKWRFEGIRSSIEEVFSEIRVVSFFWFKHRAKKGSFDWGDWCKFVNM
ncbi:putative RNA-directed DNA polymerase [Helianthus annuus]|nr:putative RNA-directed DNA polymerase [Helianthus annuus]